MSYRRPTRYERELSSRVSDLQDEKLKLREDLGHLKVHHENREKYIAEEEKRWVQELGALMHDLQECRRHKTLLEIDNAKLNERLSSALQDAKVLERRLEQAMEIVENVAGSMTALSRTVAITNDTAQLMSVMVEKLAKEKK